MPQSLIAKWRREAALFRTHPGAVREDEMVGRTLNDCADDLERAIDRTRKKWKKIDAKYTEYTGYTLTEEDKIKVRAAIEKVLSQAREISSYSFSNHSETQTDCKGNKVAVYGGLAEIVIRFPPRQIYL